MTEYTVHPIGEKQMQTPFLYKTELTQQNLDMMQQQYHDVRGNPEFIREFLCVNPNSNQTRMYLNHPEYVSWADDGSYVIVPNYPYLNRDEFDKDPKHYKDKEGGLALNAWFVHPKELEESVFSNPELRKNPTLIKQHYEYAPSLEKIDNVGHTSDRKKISELEAESGVRYLTSDLDLTKEDVPWLKKLKAQSLEHITKEFGVNENDKVDLFFHEVVGLGTATLHLHIRVNQKISALEKQRSLGLDEIIDGLESGKSVKDMLIAKKNVYHTMSSEDFPQTAEGEVRVKNQFLPQKGVVDELEDAFSSLLSAPMSFVDMVLGRRNNSSIANSYGVTPSRFA